MLPPVIGWEPCSVPGLIEPGIPGGCATWTLSITWSRKERSTVMSNSKPEFSSTTSWLPSKVCEYPVRVHVSSLLLVGFFRSISLQPENTLQDSLRLLTLWFKFGGADQVSEIVREGLATVPVDTWLQVIPQVCLQRLGIDEIYILTGSFSSSLESKPLHRIFKTRSMSSLTEVGKAHPQALIYPLTVASKSTNIIRQRAAGTVMSILRQHSPHLVEQVSLTQSVLYIDG
jgi:hypothetical protein